LNALTSSFLLFSFDLDLLVEFGEPDLGEPSSPDSDSEPLSSPSSSSSDDRFLFFSSLGYLWNRRISHSILAYSRALLSASDI